MIWDFLYGVKHTSIKIYELVPTLIRELSLGWSTFVERLFCKHSVEIFEERYGLHIHIPEKQKYDFLYSHDGVSPIHVERCIKCGIIKHIYMDKSNVPQWDSYNRLRRRPRIIRGG